MTYKVINDFHDADNQNTLYKKGDDYPKGDYKPSERRLETLTGIHPDHGKAFIKEIPEEVPEEVEEVKEEKKETKEKKTKKKE